MKKILMSLGICLMLSMTLVSAITISNVEFDYNKKTNSVHIELDQTLNNECYGLGIDILNHKDKVVNQIVPWDGSISCIIHRGQVIWGGRTGTFHRVFDIDLIEKKNIKGLGNLRMVIGDLFESRLN